MNAPAKILDGQVLEDAIWLLETRALIHAYLEYEHQYEHLADAIDPLQDFAQQSGLVAAMGQDEVQRLIAAPFARFRNIVAAEIAAEFGIDQPSDYASRLVREWELADMRDRWRWTGEMPPVQQTAAPAKPQRGMPQSTVDAFRFVVSLADADHLAAWLRAHPGNAKALLEMVEAA